MRTLLRTPTEGEGKRHQSSVIIIIIIIMSTRRPWRTIILGTLKKASAAAFQGTGSDPL
jgi:hypothetical protein